jgi:hypothetical protein
MGGVSSAVVVTEVFFLLLILNNGKLKSVSCSSQGECRHESVLVLEGHHLVYGATSD